MTEHGCFTGVALRYDFVEKDNGVEAAFLHSLINITFEWL